MSVWTKLLAGLWLIAGVVLLGPQVAPLFGLVDVAERYSVSFMASRSIQLIFWFSAFVAMSYRYLRNATAMERMEIRWVLWAFATSVATAVISTFHLVPNAVAQELFDWVILPLAMTLTPVSIALVSTNYRLWDLPDLLRSVGVFLFDLLMFSLVFIIIDEFIHFALLLAIPTLVAQDLNSWFLSTGLSGILVGLLLVTTKEYTSTFVDNVLFPQRLLSEQAIEDGKDAARDCETAQDLAWCVVATLRYGWGKTNVNFWHINEEEKWDLISGSFGEGCPVDRAQLRELEEGHSVALPNPSTRDGTPPTQLIPLLFKRELHGAILVEPAQGEFGFSGNDLEQFEQFAAAIARHLSQIMFILSQRKATQFFTIDSTQTNLKIETD